MKIPAGKQVYEVMLRPGKDLKSEYSADYPWLEAETQCEVHGKIVCWMIDGVRSAALLSPKYDSRVDANEPKVRSSPLARIVVRAGDSFERVFGRLLEPSFAPNQVKRFGELLFCLLVIPLAALSCRILAMAAIGELRLVPLGWWTIEIWMIAFAVYFSFITLRELVVVLGELEILLTEDQRKKMYAPFAFAFNWYAFLMFFATFCVMFLMDQISEFGLPPKGGISMLTSWAVDASLPFQMFFIILGLQVFGAFGAFLYYMWGATYERSPLSPLGPFSRPFRELIPVMERFGEIAIHTVLFAGAAIATLELAKRALYDPSELSKVLNPILGSGAAGPIFGAGALFRTIGLLVFILPMFVYFLFLGKMASNLIASELKRINARLREIDGSHTAPSYNDDWQRLSEEARNASKSFRWIVSVEYISRVFLAAVTLIELYLLGFLS